MCFMLDQEVAPMPPKRKDFSPQREKEEVMFHPCKCTDYNGTQCYNCLNGAHDICDSRKKCKTRKAKYPGVLLVIPEPPIQPGEGRVEA